MPARNPSIEPRLTHQRSASVHRLPLVTFAVVVVTIVAVLAVDQLVGHTGQLVLGLMTAAVLVVLLAVHPKTTRLQTLAVVGFATIGEVVGSLIWGVYAYRLDNLPAFVPPGHGLVYLAGLSLAALVRRRTGWLLVAAVSVAGIWGVAGVTVLPTPDASGDHWLRLSDRGPPVDAPPVYAGVFMVVVALELYGTAVGTWRWEPVVPGIGLSQGNPPSGVASGYVLFDVLALALLAWLGAAAAVRQSRRAKHARLDHGAGTDELRASSTFPQASQSRNPRALPSPST